MKREFEEFINLFKQAPTDEQLSYLNEVKATFKRIVEERVDVAEKELMYLKDIFKSEFAK